MIINENLPFITNYVNSLNEAIKKHSPESELSRLQRYWLSFVILGMLVTNSLCWAKFERFSANSASKSQGCWMFRKAMIPWHYLLVASTMGILSSYRIKEGFLVSDDTDHERSKNTTQIHGVPKIRDQKRSGFFNGQCIVFLILVTKKITLPVGFKFYRPDPEVTAWQKKESKKII